MIPALCVLLIACGGEGGGPGSTPEQVGDDPPTENVPGGEWEAPQYDPDELPDGMPTVQILIDEDALNRLDADPYAAPDESGVFIDGDGVSHDVDISYRGAYALQTVMNNYGLRNWKVKFAQDDRYLGRREWNFNYEPHLFQKLAYDLFRFAGVRVPGAQHVVLELNGAYQGMYLQYEDPDNKTWLWDSFGDDDGDLYKGAFDIPGQPQCFADTTALGPSDADYECHYTKKTNHNAAPGDYSVLREFIDGLNEAGDGELAAWFDTHTDVESLRSYLVVSNFIANWDSHPQRPKNFWLFEDRRTGRMAYIPWDLDLTFNPWADGTWNQMGTTASVLFNLALSEYAPPHAEEGTERPLVRRLMTLDGQQQAYLERYRELSGTILSEAYLDQRADALLAIVEPEISQADRSRLDANDQALRTFIQQRTQNVEAELDALGY